MVSFINPFWSASSAGGGTHQNVGGFARLLASNAQSLDVPYPVVSTDDIIFMALAHRAPSGAWSFGAQTGWTLIDTTPMNANDNQLSALYWKRATGSETGNFTATCSFDGGTNGSPQELCGVMWTATGVDPSKTPPYASLGETDGSGTSFTTPTTTPPDAGYLMYNVILTVGSGDAPNATPSGWTEVALHDSSEPTSYISMTIYRKTSTSGSADGPGSITLAGAEAYWSGTFHVP